MAQPHGSLTEVPGLTVGHAATEGGRSGCTVVLLERPCPLVAEVRGGAAGTRETTAFHRLGPGNRADAILLSGGSTFGLAAADGVLTHLARAGRGVPTAGGVVPRVPAAVLYDLILAGPGQRPDAALGQAACAAAGREGERGNVGAGAGATVGKLFGDAGWMRGGVGTASLQLPGGVVMGALAVVNSFGDVVDPATGTILAGARRPGSGELVDTAVYAATAARLPERLEAWHTTLVVLATDADLPHGSLTLVTQAGHDGIAAAVRPSHTHLDGDTVFAVSTSGTERRVALLRILAAARRVTELAILDGVRSATSLEGLPALGDRGAR